MRAAGTETANGKRADVALVALAVALRVAWVLAVPSKPVGDFAMYLESAAYLHAHGALDPEFVYMPGYVALCALVQALGGGWLATKVVGAVLGGLGAGAVLGIARATWNERAGRIAALLYALWPGGIAVASVTGTDMPATVLVLFAWWLLARLAPARPIVAAAAFGAAMGLAAWMRAITVPLAALSLFHFLALRSGLRRAIARAALAVVCAVVVLSPWAARNRVRYGEWVLTDSHGGLTALVGAFPNTDGRYTRALNRIFADVTGYAWLAEPHREADRAAYAVAKDWVAFAPGYALGLVGVKADRLLGRERPLLYWPLYRAGVLRDPDLAFWTARRSALEALTDGFWAGLVVLALAGLGVAAAERRWVALSIVPAQLALVALYAAFFAEARYHLPISALAFAPTGGFLAWVVAHARERRAPARRATVAAALVPALTLASFYVVVGRAEAMVERARWAVSSCRVAGSARFCEWRAEPHDRDRSPIAGVYDGAGLVTKASAAPLAARTDVALAPGTYRVRAQVDAFSQPDARPRAGLVTLAAGAAELAAVPLADLAAPNALPVGVDATVVHGGGPLVVRLRVDPQGAPPPDDVRVWITRLAIEAP